VRNSCAEANGVAKRAPCRSSVAATRPVAKIRR
jgi:hypothetical protein